MRLLTSFTIENLMYIRINNKVRYNPNKFLRYDDNLFFLAVLNLAFASEIVKNRFIRKVSHSSKTEL